MNAIPSNLDLVVRDVVKHADWLRLVLLFHLARNLFKALVLES